MSIRSAQTHSNQNKGGSRPTIPAHIISLPRSRFLAPIFRASLIDLGLAVVSAKIDNIDDDDIDDIKRLTYFFFHYRTMPGLALYDPSTITPHDLAHSSAYPECTEPIETPPADTMPTTETHKLAPRALSPQKDLPFDDKPPTAIRFAPLRVPLRRRKQTLAVLVHCSWLITSIPLFFFCCAVPLLWPLVVPYVLILLVSSASTNGKLSWRSERFRSLALWTWFADYFPARLHKTADLPADRKYIFGYHPHGIISHGAWVAFATDALGFSKKFPGITNSLLTLDSNFHIPFYREYLLLAGMCSVARESIVNVLSRGGKDNSGAGRAVTIVIGGARESLQAQPGTMRLVLHGRAGFIKVAMATGADLVPVLGFGEVDLYEQLKGDDFPLLHRFQMHVLKAYKFTLPFMRGRGVFNYDYGLMPYRRPLDIVVGRPIRVSKATSNTLDPAEVDRLHGLYVAELQRIWEAYKDVYMPDRTEEMQILP